MVVAFRMVAGIPTVFSRSAPEKADSLIFVRHKVDLAPVDVKVVDLGSERRQLSRASPPGGERRKAM